MKTHSQLHLSNRVKYYFKSATFVCVKGGETMTVQVMPAARIMHIDDVSQVCGITTVKMLYEDSRGKKHLLRYSVMGNGCAYN